MSRRGRAPAELVLLARGWLGVVCAGLAGAFDRLAVLFAANAGDTPPGREARTPPPPGVAGEQPRTVGRGGAGGERGAPGTDPNIEEDERIESVRVTEEERLTHDELAAQRQRAYPQARSAADRWGAAAAGVFTALGLTTLLQGAQRIRALDDPYEELVAGATVATFALALAAVVWAMVVAHSLSPAELGDQTAPEAVRDRPKLARKVHKALRRSQLMVTIAVILVISTMAALIFAPTDKRSTKVLAVDNTGELVCGTLNKKNGEAGILEADGTLVERVQPNSVTPVLTCTPRSP